MSYRRRGKSGTYHGIVSINGRQVWRSLHTADGQEAAIEYGKLLQRLTGRAPISPRQPQNIDWHRLVDKYIAAQNKGKETLYFDRIRLSGFQVVTKIVLSFELTTEIMLRYRGLRDSVGIMYASINRELGTVKHMARWALKEGYLSKDIEHDFSIVKPYKIDRKKNRFVFERSHIADIEGAIEGRAVDPANRGIKKVDFTFRSEHQRWILRMAAALGRYLGLRPGESVAAKWPDFNFETNIAQVSIKPGWVPKDREEREIPMFEELRTVLLKWISYLKAKKLYDPDGYVLVLENGRRPTRDYISRIFSRLLKKGLNQRKGKLYTLRHTWATYMLDLVDLATLQEWMGHEDIGTTQIYVHARREKLKELAGKKAPI